MKKLKIGIACAAILGMSTFTSCNKAELEELDQQTSTEQQYSGKELFEGVFLMSGEVADEIPSYSETLERKRVQMEENSNNHSRMDQDVVENFNNLLMADIEATNPEFFVKLQEAVYSGNAARIDAEIRNGAITFQSSIRNVLETLEDGQDMTNKLAEVDALVANSNPKTDQELIEFIETQFNDSSDSRGSLVFAIAAAVYVFVAVDIAFAVNVAGVIDIYGAVALWGPGLEAKQIEVAPERELKGEVLIKELATMPLKTSTSKSIN